ncbi:DNA-binding protein Alba [Methanotorris igneus]|uniref:DNA/RNA-binding protein Alba n=1 Tax=Methanotorris igneus (strain DSM 5666 / JCM 11834 / Kol 5) TaxID=880724 RepID=F6BCD3_METIK|nr:DNA-binding protein Alba [Methanotorris igneus]AEF96144.1 DNA/RNA-binding protein Alba [Methanotorris igneus Kol 5]
MSDNNAVYIGNKSIMNYVLAVITQFNTQGAKEVKIKARGKAISRAVDVAEMVRNRFLTDVKVKEINIGTDKIENEDGKVVNVSTIEIVLTR